MVALMEMTEEEVLAHDNRCSATNRRGKQCGNPVFYDQWYSYGWVVDEELADGRQIIKVDLCVDSYNEARMRAHVCKVHEETHSGRHLVRA